MNKSKMLLSVSVDLAEEKDEKMLYLKELQNELVDYIHMDVEDGEFVKTKSYNENHVLWMNLHTIIPLDVHLMINHPERVIENYAVAGANILTVHKEAFDTREDLVKCLKLIRKKGMLSGLALELDTSEKLLIDVLPFVDMLNIMAVPIGKSGQEFNEETYKKVQILNEMREHFKLKFKMCVDGGITPAQCKKLKDLGVDMVVTSSFLYRSEDRANDIKRLRQ